MRALTMRLLVLLLVLAGPASAGASTFANAVTPATQGFISGSTTKDVKPDGSVVLTFKDSGGSNIAVNVFTRAEWADIIDDTPAPPPAPAGSDTPTLTLETVSTTTGQRRLRWTPVTVPQFAATYELAVSEAAPGSPNRNTVYSTVSGTQADLPVVPGATRWYGLRDTAQPGKWATEVSVTYPAAQTPPSPPASNPGFQVGLGLRLWEDNDRAAISLLAPKIARFEVGAGDPNAGTRWVNFYGGLGVKTQPLVNFMDPPSNAQMDAINTWVRSFPAGKFANIEWGNENYIHRHDGGAAYATSARYMAQKLAGSGVGLLVQADDNNSGSSYWIDAMASAVPNLDQYVAGFVTHPYGEGGGHPATPRLQRIIGWVNAKGWTGPRFYLTELGLATDDGRTLSDNYGYPRDLTYAQAAGKLDQAITEFKAIPRVAQIILYQSTDQRSPGSSTDREGYFGLTRSDGSTKGPLTSAARAWLNP